MSALSLSSRVLITPSLGVVGLATLVLPESILGLSSTDWLVELEVSQGTPPSCERKDESLFVEVEIGLAIVVIEVSGAVNGTLISVRLAL